MRRRRVPSMTKSDAPVSVLSSWQRTQFALPSSCGGTRSLTSTARMGTNPPHLPQVIAHHFSVFVTDTPSAGRRLIRATEVSLALPAAGKGRASPDAPGTHGTGDTPPAVRPSKDTHRADELIGRTPHQRVVIAPSDQSVNTRRAHCWDVPYSSPPPREAGTEPIDQLVKAWRQDFRPELSIVGSGG